jgi:hypothetical protein
MKGGGSKEQPGLEVGEVGTRIACERQVCFSYNRVFREKAGPDNPRVTSKRGGKR